VEYMKKAFSLVSKNITVILPVLLAAFVPALIMSFMVGTTGAQIAPQIMEIVNNPEIAQDPTQLINTFAGALGKTMSGAIIIGLVALILNILAQPATIGMIVKAGKKEEVGANDILPQAKEHIVRFIIFIVVFFLLAAAFSIVVILLGLVFGAISAAIESALLSVLYAIAVVIATIYLSIKLSLWFVAMVADKLSVIEGLKQSFRATSGSFWTIIGILILLAIIFGIAGFIIGFLGWIPVIGPLLTSTVSAAGGAVMSAFLAVLYLEKTGKKEEVPAEQPE